MTLNWHARIQMRLRPRRLHDHQTPSSIEIKCDREATPFQSDDFDSQEDSTLVSHQYPSSRKFNEHERADKDMHSSFGELTLSTEPTSSDDECASESPLSSPSFIHVRELSDSSEMIAFTDEDSENDMSALSENQEPRPTSKEFFQSDEVPNIILNQKNAFNSFRLAYLIVYSAIMLADGLQGTHLYVLYQGYGYSVATLYSLGFISGAFISPFIGPFVDKFGRKKAAVLYCLLEIIINIMEQYPIFIGLVLSRLVGGITTNLLFSVFESWLVTEHRKRGFAEDKIEVILRDSVIVSNVAAIASGYLAHYLASLFGPVGPFEGAVVCTGFALLLMFLIWPENYGCTSSKTMTFRDHMVGAFDTIIGDSKIFRIGVIQGLTEGSLQTFVFLWSPTLQSFAANSPSNTFGLDLNGKPAYGVIFGGFMICGVLGGFIEPFLREAMTRVVMAGTKKKAKCSAEAYEGEAKPYAVEFLCALYYLISAVFLLTPFLIDKDSSYAFSTSLAAFLVYEIMVGLYMPCEGVIRSIYMPNESICSLITMLRVIVNVAVAMGVILTNFIPSTSAFAALSMMLLLAASLQLSLVPKSEYIYLSQSTNISRSWIFLKAKCYRERFSCVLSSIHLKNLHSHKQE